MLRQSCEQVVNSISNLRSNLEIDRAHLDRVYFPSEGLTSGLNFSRNPSVVLTAKPAQPMPAQSMPWLMSSAPLQ